MRAFRPIIVATVLGLSLTTTAACGSTSADGKAGSSSAAPAPLKTLSLNELTALQKQQLDKHKNVRLAMTTKQDGEAVSINMIMAINDGKPEFDMTMDSPDENGKTFKLHMIMTSKGFYVETPSGEKPPEPGKPWVDMASGGSKNPMSGMLKAMAQMFTNMADPDSSMMGSLNGATTGVTLTSAKEEPLNGQRAMHYSLSVNMEEAVKRMDLKKLMSSVGDMLGGMGDLLSGDPTKDAAGDAEIEKMRANMLKAVKGMVMTQELWVDAQNLPIKAVMNTPGMNGKPGVPTEMVYSGWGTSPVVPPPADKIGKMPADMFE